MSGDCTTFICLCKQHNTNTNKKENKKEKADADWRYESHKTGFGLFKDWTFTFGQYITDISKWRS